jgi:hypothetical protein
VSPIGLDQLDRAALTRLVQDVVSEPGTIPDPNVVIGLTDSLKQAQDAIAGISGVPTGAEISWPVPGAPAGYLAEDGSVQEQGTFPALYAVIGATFNTGGEGPTQFRLPNNAGLVIKT